MSGDEQEQVAIRLDVENQQWTFLTLLPSCGANALRRLQVCSAGCSALARFHLVWLLEQLSGLSTPTESQVVFRDLINTEEQPLCL